MLAVVVVRMLAQVAVLVQPTVLLEMLLLLQQALVRVAVVHGIPLQEEIHTLDTQSVLAVMADPA
jgi:hypothetical protein